jgi:hypothetical protein
MNAHRSIKVRKLLESRYPSAIRPMNWDDRIEGVDVVESDTGETVRLWSEGSQSPPQSGWTIVLRETSTPDKLRWTLFSI